MHYINASKHAKRDSIVRFVMYGVLGIVAISMTILSVYALRGYDVDRQTGEIIQNGLILVNSVPDRAFIDVDDNRERVRAPARLALPNGTYNVRLSLDGYRSWSSDVDVLGSEVSWLFYPKLVPEIIDTAVVDRLGAVRVYEASPHENLLAINSTEDVSKIFFYNLRDTEDEVDILTLPASLVSPGVDPKIQIVDWHGDEKIMLISLVRGGGRQLAWINIDEPQESILLPDSVFDGVDQAMFGEDERFVLYVKDGLLRNFDTRVNTSQIVGRDVVSIRHAADGRTYVITNEFDNELRYVDNDELKLITSYKQDIKILDDSVFESQTFLMIQRGDEQALLLRDPVDAGTLLVADRNFKLTSDSEVDFSADDRFVRVSDQQGTVIYDLEDAKVFKPDVVASEVIGWFDSTRLALTDGNIFSVSDFDGQNRFEIVDVDGRFLPAIDKKSDTLFSIGKSSANSDFLLQLSNLVAE